MDITTYRKQKKSTSEYIDVSVNDLVFNDEYISVKGSSEYIDIYITDSMRESLCRFVGLSPSLNRGLYNLDKDLWQEVLTKLYKYHGKEDVILLLGSNDSQCFVKGVCTSLRSPVTNEDFIESVIRYYDIVQDVSIEDIIYSCDSLVSYVTILGSTKFTSIEGRNFRIGVSFKNDETSNTTCRMVLKYDNSEIYYLPTKSYNLSSSRYDRTSKSSSESLEMLLLRVSEDFNSKYFDIVSTMILDKIRESRGKFLSYQEFERLRVTLLNMARNSDFEEEDVNALTDEINKFDDFEELYGEKDTDYLWKCTALSENPLSDLLMAIDNITHSYLFYPEEVSFLRELLGEYLIDSRFCQHIAKKL